MCPANEKRVMDVKTDPIARSSTRLLDPSSKSRRSSFVVTGLCPKWMPRRWALVVCAVLFLLGWPLRSYSQTAVTTIGVGSGPRTAVVNPVTNKIYVVNDGSATVTVIDGSSNTAIATVSVGTLPISVAVNPVTNQIYVANYGSADVTVIDGATDKAVATVPAGTNPFSVGVNPVTNKIYVANNGSANVTVIDGVANTALTTVPSGTTPTSVGVNAVTNKIYVANLNGADVTVIDGATNTTVASVPAGASPWNIGVNPVTNKIYVANLNSANVTVIDGATNAAITTVPAGNGPWSIALNPVTNKIFVANQNGGNVTVIDGSANTVVATVTAGANPFSVAVNPVTNKIFVANHSSSNVTVIDGATNSIATVADPSAIGPTAAAVDPVTNKIYVANENSNNVSVIDGVTNTAIATVLTGAFPLSATVNPVTNKIYVVNQNSNNVTVIDGAANSATTVTDASASIPFAAAVNPVTNLIYVVNIRSNNVTVIDGSTNTAIATVPVGTNPISVALNPVTNKIYVANQGSNTVTVIDGVTNTAIIAVATGATPVSVVVNPVTNKIYVANQFSANVTVIDGASDTAITTVAVGSAPFRVAVNPVTNKIYVANQFSANVTVIDGGTDTAIATVPAGTNPYSVAVNPVTNKIYVTNINSNNVTVIDGATNTAIVTMPAGSLPVTVTVNPVTNKIYVTNFASDNVTVLTEQQVQTIPLTTTISTLQFNQTTSATPSFTFTPSSTLLPTAPPPDAVYFQVDTWQNAWTAASTNTNGQTFTATLPRLAIGIHILYAFATDGQDASSIITNNGDGGGSSPVIGNIAAYLFVVLPPTLQSIAIAPLNPSILVGQTQQFTATGNYSDGTAKDITASATWTSSDGNIASISAGGLATANGGGRSATITVESDNQSASTTLTVNSAQMVTSTIVSADVNPSTFSGTVNFTATVASVPPSATIPTGSVTFYAGPTPFATLTLDGNGRATVAAGFPAGTYSITAAFTPGTGFTASTSNPYFEVVNPLTPQLLWRAPAPIVSGTPLSATQLNATTTVPGTFTYNPPAGIVLGVGNNQPLSVTFTPFDTIDYSFTTLRVQINVLPNSITVTNTNDSGAGSLRQAIADATPGATISFDPAVTGTITLTSGELLISNNLTIHGPGASTLAISGNNSSRVIETGGGTTVTISGLRIENGSVAGNDIGGGILVGGALTLSNVTLSGSTAHYGGGLYVAGGTVTLINSTVSGNTAGQSGGGLYGISGATLSVTNSTVSGNSAIGGGGIQIFAGTLTLTNSTLSGNTSSGGGAVLSFQSALTVANSTLSGNSSSSTGGGILSENGGSATFKNSILANNLPGGNCDISTTPASLGYNLADDATCAIVLTLPTDQNSTPAGLDPAGLQNNGGPTQTIALLGSSPAVDAIATSPINACTNIDGTTPIASDQRGVPRPQGSACDMGAFELGITTSLALAVPSPNIVAPGSAGPVTLSATLMTRGGPAVPGASVTFSVDGSAVGAATTDANGIATVSTYKPSSLAAGNHNVLAVSAFQVIGGSYYEGSTSATQTLIMAQGSTTTLTSSQPSGFAFGQNVTFTATVLSLGSGTPSGNVIFYDAAAAATCSALGSSTQIGTQIMSGGSASTSTISLTAGSHTVLACYSGDIQFTASSGSVSQTVTQAAPSIIWVAPAAITYGTALGVTQLNATSSTPGAFVYLPAAGAVLSAGSPTLSATFTPTDTLNFSAASATVIITVNKATASVTPAAASKIFGTADPSFTGVLSGFLAGDGVTATYNRAAGETVAGSPYVISATLSPSGGLSNYAITFNTANFAIAQANPVITWPIPAAITFGTAISATQLNASSSVPGSFTYTPSTGTVLPGGSQPLSVKFTPNDASNYGTVTGAVTLQVNQSQPTVTFTGVPVSAPFHSTFTVAATTNASSIAVISATGSCSITGNVVTMTSGTGTCNLLANWVADNNFQAASANQSSVATKIAPTTTFTGAPASAGYQSTFPVVATTSASSAALITPSGACSIAGNVVTITSGSGTCSLAANWAADNNFLAASASQTTIATKAAPIVTFTGAPATSGFHSTFSVAATTNASTVAVITASGSCSITGATVTVTKSSGTCSLSATWEIDNNFLLASAAQSTTATKATPVIAWATPIAISYGTQLGGPQLNAKATSNGSPLAGSFAYSPAAGALLGTGSHTLSVTFTPTNTMDFNSAVASVTLVVTQDALTISWANPASIVYQTALSNTQLNAKAVDPSGTAPLGSFAYTPALGTLLSAGSHTLSVTFTPSDTINFTTASGGVTIQVNKDDSATTITSNSPHPSLVGQPVILGFKVIDPLGNGVPTGSVTVSANTGETCSGALAPSVGGSCLLTFATAGSRTITATYAGDSNFKNSSGKVAQSVVQPKVSLSAASRSFGNQKLNTTSAAKTVTLTNTGTATLNLFTLTISGDFAFAPGTTCASGGSVAPGANCVINVAFVPTVIGARTGSITITDNAPNSPQLVTLSGTGN